MVSSLNGRIGLDDFKVSFSTDILQVSHHPEALRVRTPFGETLRIEVLGAFLGFSSSPLCLKGWPEWGREAACGSTVSSFCSLTLVSQVWSERGLHSPELGLGRSGPIVNFPVGGLSVLHIGLEAPPSWGGGREAVHQ